MLKLWLMWPRTHWHDILAHIYIRDDQWQAKVILSGKRHRFFCSYFIHPSVWCCSAGKKKAQWSCLKKIIILKVKQIWGHPPLKRRIFLLHYVVSKYAEHWLMLGLWNLLAQREGDRNRERYWEKKRRRAAGERAFQPHLYSPPSNSLQFIYISATSIATAGGLSGASLI